MADAVRMKPGIAPKYRAALFDLDDTLFDHRAHRQAALAAVAGHVPALSGASAGALEAAHEAVLQRTYQALLDGTLSLAQSRTERMRELLQYFGLVADEALAAECEAIYRSAYDCDWQPVPGARELLSALRELGLWIGIITNGLQVEQAKKVRTLRLEDAIEGMFVSETVGAQKPGREFFDHVLARTGFVPADCIVVGDLWETDIQGALNAGMDSIWLNRYGRSGGPNARVTEVASLLPTSSLLRLFAGS